MSFIDFESGTAKERARQELRDARSELLKNAEKRFHHRQEQEVQKKLRGDDDWMLPAVARKIEQQSTTGDRGTTSSEKSAHKKSSKKGKKEKKIKKSKKEKKSKRKKKYSSSDSDSDSESEDEERQKNRKHRRKGKGSSSASSESDEWVESGAAKTVKAEAVPVQRDDWMSGMLIPTFSKKETAPKKDERVGLDKYDPKLSARELNPFWKNGGSGLPSFQKPSHDSDDEERTQKRHQKSRTEAAAEFRGNWRKKNAIDSRSHEVDRKRSPSPERSARTARPKSPEWGRKAGSRRSASPETRTEMCSSASSSRSPSPSAEPIPKPRMQDFMTDQQMNDLGAKIIKAEIMGNDDLAKTLKEKLEAARIYRTNHKHELLASNATTNHRKSDKEDVLLTATNSQGFSKPLKRTTAASSAAASDPWGGRGKKGKKSTKVETHSADGERLRFFADDDKYDIKQMFEREKFTTANEQDEQFVNISGKHKNPNDDLEDIFAENVRHGQSDAHTEERDRTRAIRQHQEMTRTLDSCDKCFDSPKMEKQLIVAMGTNVYLSLPWHEGLQLGHCQIVPIQHVACCTNLDEDVWREVVDFQKAITKMFRSRGQDVIFFETARYLHKRPHLAIQCVPHKDFELAPFYFKKAIQESEREWSTNKQLVTIRDKDLRRSIPKGLPYFWVHFGVDNGFAHVIEEQDRFPSNFAQEIIGGLLNLDARQWRKLRKEQNPIPKVKQFGDWWKAFDITA